MAVAILKKFKTTLKMLIAMLARRRLSFQLSVKVGVNPQTGCFALNGNKSSHSTMRTSRYDKNEKPYRLFEQYKST